MATVRGTSRWKITWPRRWTDGQLHESHAAVLTCRKGEARQIRCMLLEFFGLDIKDKNLVKLERLSERRSEVD